MCNPLFKKIKNNLKLKKASRVLKKFEKIELNFYLV